MLADSNLSRDNIIQKHFHDTLDMIEELASSIAADPEKIYALIEHVCQDRSVSTKKNYYSFSLSSARRIFFKTDDPLTFILQ